LTVGFSIDENESVDTQPTFGQLLIKYQWVSLMELFIKGKDRGCVN